MYDIHLFLWWHCDQSGVDDIDVDATLIDVDVTANDVDKNVADPKVLTSRQQDRHLIDTDKLNSVTDL